MYSSTGNPHFLPRRILRESVDKKGKREKKASKDRPPSAPLPRQSSILQSLKTQDSGRISIMEAIFLHPNLFFCFKEYVSRKQIYKSCIKVTS